MRRLQIRSVGGVCLWLCVTGGCGDIFASRSAPLFETPLAIDGESVGTAVIDTGGGYELMLRDSFGLKVVDTVEVVGFGGREEVGVTEGFSYTVGGWPAAADSALVGLSVCDCNGLGFHFFRKTGAVLALDFPRGRASFLYSLPLNASQVILPFASSPPHLEGFDSAFIEVDVRSGGDSRPLLALLDTGTNASVIRRGLVGRAAPLAPDRVDLTVTHEILGAVALQAGLFDVPDLPDLILGTDVMRVWGDKWYFLFTPEGGAVAVAPLIDTPPTEAVSSSALGLAE